MFNNPKTSGDLSFDEFLEAHPEVAERIEENRLVGLHMFQPTLVWVMQKYTTWLQENNTIH
jgi:hypothetical protein